MTREEGRARMRSDERASGLLVGIGFTLIIGSIVSLVFVRAELAQAASVSLGIAALLGATISSRRAGKWRWDYELEPANPFGHLKVKQKRAMARPYRRYSPKLERLQEAGRQVRNTRRLAGLKPDGTPMNIEPPLLNSDSRDFEGREV
jgi:hypothetical protein